jgi:hypothetical protein
MPAPITVAINIIGSVGGSLPKAFSSTIAGLKGIQHQANLTSGAMRGLFGFGVLGAGIGAFAGMKAFLTEGVKLAREQENSYARLTVELRNQALLHHQNLDLVQGQTNEILKQAKALESYTGMSRNVFLQGATQLAQTRISPAQIRRLQPIIANLLADQRMKGQPESSMADIYGAVTQAIRGRGQALARLGVYITDAESRMMKLSSLTGNFSYSLSVISKRINEAFGGAAARRLKTFEGQMEMMRTHTQAWQRVFGKAFEPVEQALTKIGVIILDAFGRDALSTLKTFSAWITKVADNFNVWMANFKKTYLPAIEAFGKGVWKSIIEAFQWIIAHKTELLDVFKELIALWAIMKVIAIGIWLYSLLNPINLVIAAVVLLTLTWRNYYTELVDIWNRTREMMFGSKSFTAPMAAHGLAPGYPSGNSAAAQAFRRSHGWGTAVRSALPIEKGWVQTFLDFIKPIDDAFEKFRVKFWKGWDKGLADFKIDWGNITAWLIQNWNSTVDAVTKAWKAFLDWWNPAGGTGSQTPGGSHYPAAGGGGGGGGSGGGEAAIQSGNVAGYRGAWASNWVRLPSGRMLYSPPPTMLGYSPYEQHPWEGDSSNIGPLRNRLYVGSNIGLGINIQKQKGLNFGDWVYVGPGSNYAARGIRDPWQGWRQFNETSSRVWGMELYSADHAERFANAGNRRILRIMKAKEMKEQQSRHNPEIHPHEGASAVHIHNNVTYNLHGGTSDLENRVAHLHRNHIDNLKRDMEEVFHRLARGSFVNRSAWT